MKPKMWILPEFPSVEADQGFSKPRIPRPHFGGVVERQCGQPPNSPNPDFAAEL
jgi:hypothetical protein